MSESAVITATSNATNPGDAAMELAARLNQPHIGFVLFFCSSAYPLDQLTRALKTAFANMPMAGCTSAGEVSALGYGQGTLVAVGFSHRHFHICGELITDLEHASLVAVQAHVSALLEKAQHSSIAPVKGHSFALTLVDGLCTREEQVLAMINAALGSIPQTGASAADRIDSSKNTWVFLNGEFHANAAVLLLVTTRFDFKVFSRHHLLPAQCKLVVTDADEQGRCVREFNCEPAAEVYARMVGVPLEALDARVFALNPVAVKLSDQYYIRAIKQRNRDNSLTFYSAVETGIVMTRMERSELRQHLLQLLQDVEGELGKLQLTLGFDCLCRRVEAQACDIGDQLAGLFERYKMLGFNTFGEHYSGMVFNQTFSGVAIGQESYD